MDDKQVKCRIHFALNCLYFVTRLGIALAIMGLEVATNEMTVAMYDARCNRFCNSQDRKYFYREISNLFEWFAVCMDSVIPGNSLFVIECTVLFAFVFFANAPSPIASFSDGILG